MMKCPSLISVSNASRGPLGAHAAAQVSLVNGFSSASLLVFVQGRFRRGAYHLMSPPLLQLRLHGNSGVTDYGYDAACVVLHQRAGEANER